jgi:hypothetical protein
MLTAFFIFFSGLDSAVPLWSPLLPHGLKGGTLAHTGSLVSLFIFIFFFRSSLEVELLLPYVGEPPRSLWLGFGFLVFLSPGTPFRVPPNPRLSFSAQPHLAPEPLLFLVFF